MIVLFKINNVAYSYTESSLKSIIVGERIQDASDFEFTLNSFDGDIGDILYQSVYINGVHYIATDIEYHKDENTEEYIVSGVKLGDYILDISIAKEDYVYQPGEIGINFLYRVLNDSVPQVKIDGQIHYIDISLSEEYLPLDLEPPKRGNRISDWLTEQLKDLRYVYYFEETILHIGRKQATSAPAKIFTKSFNIEKKKGDYWDCFWYKNDPYLMFLKKNEDANKPYHDIRTPKKPYYSVKDNAPDLLAVLNKVFTLDEGCRFSIEKFTTNSGEYVVFLRILGDYNITVNMEFDKVFQIPDFDDERRLMEIIRNSGYEYHYDEGRFDEIIPSPIRIESNDYYEWAVPGSWRVWMPHDTDWPSDNNYWRYGFLLARGSTSSMNTDRYQCPNGFNFFEGIGLLEPLYSNEKTASQLEVDSDSYQSLNLLDRVCFGIERIARPQICTEKVLTIEDGAVHYDIKVDDQMQIQ